MSLLGGRTADAYPYDGAPKIVLDSKIALWQQRLPTVRRPPIPKTAIAQGFNRDQHNLWDTTYPYHSWALKSSMDTKVD
jgi:hypothetical protein